MKKVILLFLFYPCISFSQCTIEDILIFDPGISKFDVITKSKSVKGVKESPGNSKVTGSWQKPGYLTDSVFMDQHVFDVANMQCYKNNHCTYVVYFTDDKLFKQNIQIDFDANNFEDYSEIYSKMAQLFNKDFPYSKPITINQPGNKIKQGEGFVFTVTDMFQEKTEQVKIYKTIQYKRDGATGGLTNEIDKYLIVIESVNLKDTKLDNRGY